jgi:SnoaL-like domain
MTYHRLCRLTIFSVFLLPCAISVAAQSLPPKKPQPTLEKVLAEHIAALNTCDWNRAMAQYDDDIIFLSKDGGILQGREAIGKMFQRILKDTSQGGLCGRKLIPEHIFVVGNTVNVVWRMEAPFFAEPYRVSEAFETKNGLLVAQITTSDSSAIKMKK